MPDCDSVTQTTLPGVLLYGWYSFLLRQGWYPFSLRRPAQKIKTAN